MTKSELVTLKSLAKSLKNSAKREWKQGDLDAWYDYANDMRQTILTSVDVMEELTKLDSEEEEGLKIG